MDEAVGRSLWNAVRQVQENAPLMEHIASHAREAGQADVAALFDRNAAETRRRGELVRRAVMSHEAPGGEKASRT